MPIGLSMWRRIGSALCVGFCLSLASLASAASPLGPARFAAVLMNPDTNEILFEEQGTAIRHPASITKVMTLYLVFDALDSGRLKLSDDIVISRHAAAQKPSRLGLAPGRSISVEDAIQVVAVKSANDIAVALAEKIGGTESNFARLMTLKARALGMRQTMFANASGLPDPAHFTSARDIAILSAALLRYHADRYHVFSEQSFAYGGQRMANHNHLLGNVVGLDGIKTGFTVDSGFTLTASAMRDGKRLIAVVLGAPTSFSRNRDIIAMLDAGFTALKLRASGMAGSLPAILQSNGFALNRTERPMPGMAIRPVEEGDSE
ncbi:D-alanyl-D-alanine carboxypeptidase [Sphingomonas sp. YR710]|uniref:D-alanyl-D-alanine carboxypeptidase family protein n=1 Tax=Sphingomonas sp. YR710 TaxID=1882773 RepID=UPI00088833E7|nr:D-alanyl-D-alanine carboxypeptidase family protein [Sphingomonas sp. YR710]SDC02398.1 D-alanyl-D-alanine carboxypeptidase [Sphingomonas sp. YR710]